MQLSKVITLAASLLIAPLTHAQIKVYTSELSGGIESPPNASPATGSATITFDLDLVTMRVQAFFDGLTGPVSASHIHSATSTAGTGVAGVATQIAGFPGFPNGSTSGSYDQVFDMTSASSYSSSFITSNGNSTANAFAALVAAFDGGKAYLNIHTSTFPAGEIRGFPTATAIPEPSSYVGLAGLTVLMAVVVRRRR